MARPTKQGMDYFPLDCDFLSDEKVIAVNVNFGAKGIAVIVALLCAIYRNGYYAQWNDILRLKVAGQLSGVSDEMVTKVVEVCLKYGFFDKGLFESDGVLTSRAIQRRYFEAAKRRVNDSRNPYLLVSVYNNPVNVDNNPVNVNNNPPKVNKIKENPPCSPPGGGGDGKEETFFSLLKKDPDALTKRDGVQRNYTGLIEALKALGIPGEEAAQIAALSNYGQIGHPVWKLLLQCRESKGKRADDKTRIKFPGKYIISQLRQPSATST